MPFLYAMQTNFCVIIEKMVIWSFQGSSGRVLDTYCRRRMEREAKAKVVASVWGADFVQFPCRASCFASVDLEETVEFILFFQIDRCKIASAARNLTKSVPKQMRRPLPLLLSPSFFYGTAEPLTWGSGFRDGRQRDPRRGLPAGHARGLPVPTQGMNKPILLCFYTFPSHFVSYSKAIWLFFQRHFTFLFKTTVFIFFFSLLSR